MKLHYSTNSSAELTNVISAPSTQRTSPSFHSFGDGLSLLRCVLLHPQLKILK